MTAKLTKNVELSSYVLLSNNSEDDDKVIVSGNDQTLIMRSKGSDKFLVCYFD